MVAECIANAIEGTHKVPSCGEMLLAISYKMVIEYDN
jgi:hypothetical protein